MVVGNRSFHPGPDRRTGAAAVPGSSMARHFGPPFVHSRSAFVAAPVAATFRSIRRIGGTTGWYYANWLWRLRGWLDLLVGGVGIRRGRRDRENLEPGDVLDCWRVEHVEPDRRLLLVAEMKLPGLGWLDFEALPDVGGARVTQTTTFAPAGPLGILYWYALWPIHELIFRGMLRNLARDAETFAAGDSAKRHEG